MIDTTFRFAAEGAGTACVYSPLYIGLRQSSTLPNAVLEPSAHPANIQPSVLSDIRPVHQPFDQAPSGEAACVQIPLLRAQ